MTEPPTKNDSSAQWPEEVRQAYEHLKIPSLYDVVLMNEKLSLEIRRQDRDLHAMKEEIQKLSSQIHTLLEMLSEPWEEYEEDLIADQDGFIESSQGIVTDLEAELLDDSQAYQDILMETYDSIQELSQLSRQRIHQFVSLSLVQAIDRLRYQLLSRLKEMQIEMIDPQPGEVFNPSFHHVLEHVQGGQPGTIAHRIRVGFQQNDQILRFAEVAVYH